jgi:hypothetical protein
VIPFVLLVTALAGSLPSRRTAASGASGVLRAE